MKRIFKYFGAFLTAALMGAFTGCNILEPVSESADLGLGVKVFFPTKVVAGQPMTINGSGFTGVKEIVFPDGVRVTDFEIVSNEMIRVTAPAGLAAAGGKILVRTTDEEAESRLALTLGKTVVSGFSKQEGEEIGGGEQLTIYGEDLEFINKVELLDADGNPLIIEDAGFYRKGESSVIITIPKKNIFDGKFIGKLYTYDGREFPLPELIYKPASDGGHWETQLVPFWENELGKPVSWSGDYRFAGEGHSTGEEIAVLPEAVWNRLKSETFYLKVQADDPQIRVTTGWWSGSWCDKDFQPGNDERLVNNGDGTFTLEINLSDPAYTDLIDEQHLLFTGDRFTPIALLLPEDVWVDGGEGHMEIVKTSIWKNELGNAVSWSSDYRFAGEGHSTGEEIYVVPADVWEKMKTTTFYIDVTADDPQIRVTTGWWSGSWCDKDFQPGNDERLVNNGDGTFTLEINLSDPAYTDLIDEQHLLFTGDRFTPIEIYFAEEVWVDGGGGPQEVEIWKNELGNAVSWSSDYRFAGEGHSTGEEIYVVPADVWEKMKTTAFYLDVTADDPQIRVTTGWWSGSWCDKDFQPGNDDRLVDNGDGTFTLTVTLYDPAFVDLIDEQHLLFTGDRFTPIKLYFLE